MAPKGKKNVKTEETVNQTPAPQTASEVPASNGTNEGSKRGRKASPYPSLLNFKSQIKDIKRGAPVPAGLTEIPEVRGSDHFITRHRGYQTTTFPRVNGAFVEVVNLATEGYGMTPVVNIQKRFEWNGADLVEVAIPQDETTEAAE